MQSSHRRKFLQLLGTSTLASTLPDGITRALAIPANSQTGTIADVEHIVILTQENRSFDHYFGAMRGVRGFNDPRAVTLPNGQSVWHQPTTTGSLLPYRPDVPDLGMQFLPDPPHGWTDSHAAWNGGRYDQWVPSKGQVTMAYLTRTDIPYHYALADAFTICDAYHCSLLGPTDPNRYHMWTGWVGNDGKGGGPVITNAEVGYDWSTYPERLQKAGITWKVYQDVGVGLDASGFWGWTVDPYIGNYGDNSLLYFHQYQNALPGTPLADNAKTGTNVSKSGSLIDQFRDDVRAGKLPQVSWITAPEAFSEHPNFPANYGAWFISQFLDVLTENPDVWSKTAFFVHYDENGGFFDHMIPATPPQSAAQGLSTIDTVNEIFPGDAAGHPAGPYGLGVRVPMLVISPWSKGGFVNSEVFDHTSLIRFIEARFAATHPGLIETNITPWRRAVAGDLTSAFNFKKPNASVVSLPATQSYQPLDKLRHPDYNPVVPTVQSLPVQEPGVRAARALPYDMQVQGRIDDTDGSFALDFDNAGKSAVVYQVRSAQSDDAPRSYTVAPHAHLSDKWTMTPAGARDFNLSVYGPNGFLRAFKCGTAGMHRANLLVKTLYETDPIGITMLVSNQAAYECEIAVTDRYTGKRIEHELPPGDTVTLHWSLAPLRGWYDLVITVEDDPALRFEFAGHIENGRDSITDPGMGGYPMKG